MGSITIRNLDDKLKASLRAHYMALTSHDCGFSAGHQCAA